MVCFNRCYCVILIDVILLLDHWLIVVQRWSACPQRWHVVDPVKFHWLEFIAFNFVNNIAKIIITVLFRQDDHRFGRLEIFDEVRVTRDDKHLSSVGRHFIKFQFLELDLETFREKDEVPQGSGGYKAEKCEDSLAPTKSVTFVSKTSQLMK